MNNSQNSAQNELSRAEIIAHIRQKPHNGDTIRIGEFDYRYTNQSNQGWQKVKIPDGLERAHWASISRLGGEHISHEELLTLLDQESPEAQGAEDISAILAILDMPTGKPIISFRGKEYRYTARGGRWQVRDVGHLWASEDYLKGPFQTTEELRKLVKNEEKIDTIQNTTQEKIQKILENPNISAQNELLDKNWAEIVDLRQKLESDRQDGGIALSLATKMQYEKILADLLEQRKKLTQNKKRSSDTPKKDTKPLLLEWDQKDQKRLPYYKDEWENTPETEVAPPGEVVPTNPETEPTEGESEPTKPESTPEKTPQPDIHIAEIRDISANISDVSANLQDVARARAEERLRTEQGQANWLKRATRFFTRNTLLEQYTAEELAKLENESRFDDTTRHIRENAARRFAQANTLFADNAINTRDTIEDSVINGFAAQFVTGAITQKAFEDEFENILLDSAYSDRLRDLRQQGTNIVVELSKQKAIYDLVTRYPTDPTMVESYLDTFLQNSSNRAYLEEILGVKTRDDIAHALAFAEIREKIAGQEIRVKIDIVTGGEAAYAIDNSSRQDGNAYKIGKFLQKHPILSSVTTGLGITAASLAAGPFGNLIAGTLGIGSTTGLRRGAEYTDEHAGFEKRITQGTHKDAAIYQSVEQLRNELASATGLKKQWIAFRLKNAEKKLELYQQQGVQKEGLEARNGTTHRHIAPISSLNRKLQAYLQEKEGFALTPENQERFKAWIIQGLARLDAWKKTGHNFLKSNSEEAMEADYAILYENVLLSEEKATASLDDLRSDERYVKTMEGLMADFNRAERSFESTRKNTAVKSGVIHGGIYGATSMVFQWLSGTGLFYEPKTIAGAVIPGTTSVNVDPAIAKDLQNALGAQKYQAFVDHLSNSTNPNTLWDTLTKDIFNNPNIGNDTKNQIMTFILNATDVQNGVTKPELLIEAAKSGIFNDISNGGQKIDHVLQLMQKWGYGSVNKTWLIDTIRGIDAGTLSVNTLSPTEQTKVAEALWCYVHRNGQAAGSQLWQVFMDTTTTAATRWADVAIPATLLEKMGMFGIPTWKNTFLSALKKQKNTESDILVEKLPPADIYDDSGKKIDTPKDPKDTKFIDEKDLTDEEEKKIEEIKKVKPKEMERLVITRWEKWSVNEIDIWNKYPENFAMKSDDEILNFLVDTMWVFEGTDYQIKNDLKNGKISRDEAKKLFARKIQWHREQLGKNQKIYTEVLEHAYEAVEAIFKKYNLDPNRLIGKKEFLSKVSILSFYDFMAQNNYSKSSNLGIAGVNYSTSGKIMLNALHLLHLDMEKQIRAIKHTAIHELLHGVATQNFWNVKNSSNKLTIPRRNGLLMFNGDSFHERGRGLNEAIVEGLSYEMMLEIFGKEYTEEGNRFYNRERGALQALVEYTGISKADFYQTAYNRDKLMNLARLMEGQNRERPKFLALVMNLMDSNPEELKNLLNGGKFFIHRSLYANTFHPSLLNQAKNNFSDEILAYIETDEFGLTLKRKTTRTENERGI